MVIKQWFDNDLNDDLKYDLDGSQTLYYLLHFK